MPTPQWPDTLLPSRATRRRIRLRQDFKDSMLASDLDDEDFSSPAAPSPPPPVVVRPTPSRPAAAAMAAVPTDSQFRRDHLMRTLPLPAVPSPPAAVPKPKRPDLWPETDSEDNPSTLARFARIAAIGGALLVCGLVLTKGLAEMVWEFVSH